MKAPEAGEAVSPEVIMQWDVSTWSRALAYWEQSVDWSRIGTALELGGRQGGPSLWLAQKGIQVICSDYKDTEHNAKALHERYKVSGAIAYQDIDATSIPYSNHFDLIVFKSIIGGIGRGDNKAIQAKVFSEIHKALKPGGVLIFAENLVASRFHQSLRKHFTKWGGDWRYLSTNELEDFLSPFSRKEIKTTGCLATLGRNELQRKALAHIDAVFFNWSLPRNWHYLAYGMAVK